MEVEVQRPWWRSPALIEGGKTIAYALLIAVVIRTFLFQPFNIPSSSMENTLLIGDYLFVSKFSYGYSKHSFPWSVGPFDGRVLSGQPQRGDVVVFKLPARPWEDYIKRVVGLPGDRVQMIGGVLHINGEPCKMEKIADWEETLTDGSVNHIPRYLETLPGGVTHEILDRIPNYFFDDTQEFVVPPGHYFMMGDNRDNSNDSRVFDSGVGFVPEENLVGRADIIFFSTDGSAEIWEFWKWPWAIRWSRFFRIIE